MYKNKTLSDKKKKSKNKNNFRIFFFFSNMTNKNIILLYFMDTSKKKYLKEKLKFFPSKHLFHCFIHGKKNSLISH